MTNSQIGSKTLAMRILWASTGAALLQLGALTLATPALALVETPQFMVAAVEHEPEAGEAEIGRYDPMVRVIQLRLAERGLYEGEVGGVMTPETAEAVRAYQRIVGLEVDGRPTAALLAHLNSTEGAAKELLGKLDAARKAQIEEARAALIQEFGRDWATAPNQRDRPSSRPIDRDACFTAPTPDCLIALALDATRGIKKDDLRDWALSAVVEAQVRAGRRGAALDTARTITDPRSVIAAVGAIAIALANRGDTGEAVKAAERVPDKTLRDKALRAVAEGEARGGNPAAAARAARRIKADGERLHALLAAAEGFVAAGDNPAANALHAEATETIQKLKQGPMRDFATGSLAGLEASLGRLSMAKETAGEIADPTERARALAEIARTQLRQSKRADAKATLEAAEATLSCPISQPDCQHVHARLAIVRGELGDHAGAMSIVHRLKPGYARVYAHREVAIAIAQSGALEDAETLAQVIPDVGVRLEALLGIADAAAARHDAAHARAGRKRAAALARTLENPVERAFSLIDVALLATRRGEPDVAASMLKEAIMIARDLEDPFGLARSLSRIATALALLNGG